jgi:hypothetical protein
MPASQRVLLSRCSSLALGRRQAIVGFNKPFIVPDLAQTGVFGTLKTEVGIRTRTSNNF